MCSTLFTYFFRNNHQYPLWAVILKTRLALDRFHDSSKVNALVCSMLYSLCSMLYALCSMLYALCSMLYALCSMLYALCSMLYALCSMLYALCSMLYALCAHTPTHAHTCPHMPKPSSKIFYDFKWLCWQFFAAAFWTTLLTIFCDGFLDDFVDNFLRLFRRFFTA